MFFNIINKDLTDWVTYICINSFNKDVIQKSHLYFSTVLKIVDDELIEKIESIPEIKVKIDLQS
jgi:hypothetical protein